MQQNTKLRLVAYIRVSTDAQVDGYGLEVQTQALTAWCKANGITPPPGSFQENMSMTVGS